jgi:hypothetical protein
VWLFLFITVYWWGGAIPVDPQGFRIENPSGVTKGSLLKWFTFGILPNFSFFWAVFSLAETSLTVLANLIFYLFWRTNKIDNFFVKSFFNFVENLTKIKQIKLLLFTIVFSVPNKIWVNNNMKPLVTYFAGIFVCGLGLFLYPFLLFCYVMYIWLIIFSFIFAYFYQTFPQFSSYINKFLFGEPDSDFAQVYFSFFWGNMMNAAKKTGPAAIGAASTVYGVQKKRESEQR